MSQSSYFQSAKWALITGATSGIGLAYTKELAKQNKPVVLVARSEARLKEVSGELNNQYSALTRYIMADLFTREGAKAHDFIFAVTDITLMKEHHEQLERMAHYDVLTNLPNRVLLADRLSHSMVRCQRRNQSLAVACMDLDGFKAVNDLHGHIVGDELIVEVAQRMKEALREGDTLARIGGDEFIAVMVDLENIEDSEPVLKRLLKAAADPVTLGDAVIQISASIGVSLYPQDHVDADLLMRHADQAMYVAKQAGKNRYHFFDTTQDNAIKTQGQTIDDIRSALDRLEFVLHYQPKVNMHTSEVIGAEALIRWQHPVRGLVPPLDFLTAIEGHVISLELGEWVIDTALSQINQWRSMGVELPISVNISAYQLQQLNFSTRLAALLAAHPGVNPHYLELEILETSVLSDISQVFDTMSACHDLGVRFALDDFGTGYSSLTHIKRLPAYLIKIDQSFVRDMLEDVDDLAIVESVIGLAKTFKREVIAEGVETIEHGVALLKLGCELAQGYGIARPMTAGDIPEWVSNWKADDSWQAYKG
jgi:diguanylate cyclase (GGDEF)-like protein